MWLFTFTAARTALSYITVGALTLIWAGVWYVYLFNNPSETQTAFYWCSGFLITGLALSVIGLALSLINRRAQQTNVPAAAPPVAGVNVQPNATPAVPVPAIIPNGQVVVAPLEDELVAPR